MRFLILVLILLEFLLFFRLQSVFFHSTEQNSNEPEDDLNKLNVKELKELAVKLQKGRSLKKTFVEKSELIDFVEKLRKSNAGEFLCGNLKKLNSKIYQLHHLHDLEDFIYDEEKI